MSWVLPVLTGVAEVMSAVTFIQFIEEESIQACMLGSFLALKAKNYKAANIAIQRTQGTLLLHLKLINESMGWLAPYSKGCFQDYVIATETLLEVYYQLFIQAQK
jgi:hypothetical protein